MAKPNVQFTPLKLRGSASVKKKRVRQANGETVTFHFIDTESPTFDIDLSAIFAKNVAKARRENLSISLKPRKHPILSGNSQGDPSTLRSRVDLHFKKPQKKNTKSPKAQSAKA
jgi:hypothetical protein